MIFSVILCKYSCILFIFAKNNSMSVIQTYPNARVLSNEEYHADISHISKSGLDLIDRSPLHYWSKYLDPSREAEERKQHFIIGTAVHAAILEPHLFEQAYFRLDDAAICAEIGGAKPRATTRYKEWFAGQLAASHGKQILGNEDYVHCLRMRDAVWTHPAAQMLLERGYREQSFFFNELQTGAPTKIRPDNLNDHLRWIVDVKTTDDARPTAFGRSFFSYRYHVQSALLLDGMNQIDEVGWNGVAFIAVEKEPPYAVGVYYASEQDIEDGRIEYRRNLATYMECRQTGEWPAYGDSLTPIQRPGWMK